MRVKVRYATAEEVSPVQLSNPYDGLEFCVSGDIETVANWIDETFNAFYQVMGGLEYKQGIDTEYILKQLKKGGIQEFGNVAFHVTHLD
jgi:hypothetical protein